MPRLLNLKINTPEDAKCLIPIGEEVSVFSSSNSSGQLHGVNRFSRESCFPRSGASYQH